MNANIEYEKSTKEIYQELVNADVLKATRVQHNVKLKSKSGQEHQIDVYWEYEIAGVRHRVAIECKNYNRNVEIGKVRDFYGVLSDLNNVAGIMVTKVGYQKGAKEYASTYGITLKELREPNWGEAILGQIELNLNMSTGKKVQEYLNLPENKSYKEIAQKTTEFLSGFYSSLGLELLSRIDYIRQTEKIYTHEEITTHLNNNTSGKYTAIDNPDYVTLVNTHLANFFTSN